MVQKNKSGTGNMKINKSVMEILITDKSRTGVIENKKARKIWEHNSKWE